MSAALQGGPDASTPARQHPPSSPLHPPCRTTEGVINFNQTDEHLDAGADVMQPVIDDSVDTVRPRATIQVTRVWMAEMTEAQVRI
jgi:hypothetical protein